MRWLHRSLFWTAAIAVAVGCGNKGQGREFSRPTLVSVDPAYLADAHCGDRPGQMQAYVATLWDTTPFDSAPALPDSDCELTCGLYDLESGDFVELITRAECEAMAQDPTTIPSNRYILATSACDWFQLPSSGLVDCNVPVGFSFVAIGHEYMARVEGYERTDLVPLTTGSPVMTDPDSGDVVAPTWVWACTHPAIAVRNWDNPLVECQLLGAPPPDQTTTSIEVDTSALLGDLECGDAPTRVATLEVVLDPERPVVRELACDETASFVELADGSPLVAGATYSLEVSAYATGTDDPTWETTCFADTVRGVSVRARCSPLTPIE
jgi:hypothetical protein